MSLETNSFHQRSVTREYVPTVALGLQGNGLGVRYVRFTPTWIPYMLIDPRINFGLSLIKGPIVSKARLFISLPEKTEVKEFLVKNITRFWLKSVNSVLSSVEWGFSGNEIIYTHEGGVMNFDRTKSFGALDCMPRKSKKSGEVRGIELKIKNSSGSNEVTCISYPNILWNVPARHINPFWGDSQLRGAFQPWHEKWSDSGFREARRLFFYKYAYDGGGIYYPEGATRAGPVGADGLPAMKANVDIANEILQQMKTGGTIALPNKTNTIGGSTVYREWERIPPMTNPPPVGLMEYGDNLDDEMFEGMSVPPEVARAEGTGAYAGRVVPQEAFYSTLQTILYSAVMDFDTYCLRPMVAYNFGPGIEYEIHPFSLMEDYQDPMDQMQQMQGQTDQPFGNQSQMSLQDIKRVNAKHAQEIEMALEMTPAGMEAIMLLPNYGSYRLLKAA